MRSFQQFIEGIRGEFPINGDSQNIVNTFLIAADKAEEEGKVGEWVRWVIGWYKSQVQSVIKSIDELPLTKRLLQKSIENTFLKKFLVYGDTSLQPFGNVYSSFSKRHLQDLFNSIVNSLLIASYDLEDPELIAKVENIIRVVRGVSEKFEQLFTSSPYGVNNQLTNTIKDFILELPNIKSFSSFAENLEQLLPVLRQYVNQSVSLLDDNKSTRDKEFFVYFYNKFKEMKNAIAQHNFVEFEKNLAELADMFNTQATSKLKLLRDLVNEIVRVKNKFKFTEGIREEFPINGMTNAQDIIDTMHVAADKAQEEGKTGEWVRMVIGWLRTQITGITDEAINSPGFDISYSNLSSVNIIHRTKELNKILNFKSDYYIGMNVQNITHVFNEIFKILDDLQLEFDREGLDKIAERIELIKDVLEGIMDKFKELFSSTPHGLNNRLVNGIVKIVGKLGKNKNLQGLAPVFDDLLEILKVYVQQPISLLDPRKQDRSRTFYIEFYNHFVRMREAIAAKDVKTFNNELREATYLLDRYANPNFPASQEIRMLKFLLINLRMARK